MLLIDPDRRFTRLVYLKCFIHERQILFVPDSKDQAWPGDSDFEIFSQCYGQKVGNVMLLAVLPGLCVKVTQVMTIKAPTLAHKWS